MAYTSAWNNTVPLGTAAANTIDELFRSLKVDISERLLSVFAAIDADPLVIKSGVTTAGTFSVGSTLTVGGTSTLMGNATIGGTLGVTGAATFSTNITQSAGIASLKATTVTTLAATGDFTHGVGKRQVIARTAMFGGIATTLATGSADNEIDYFIITGQRSGSTIGFIDVVAVYYHGVSGVAPVVISSTTLVGVPATRTYTHSLPTKEFKLQLSGADQYFVKVTPLRIDPN